MSLTFALQALLARHEQFLLEAGDERKRMADSIDCLEQEKERLKASNAQMIEENRHLLDQLESLNQTIASGDEHIKSLTMTLQSSKQENLRLSMLAARATELEKMMSACEAEQFDLREQVTVKEEDERTAIQRWRIAERTITDLQDQVDKIEKEANEERGRHAEVMARLERRNAVERELGTAAGRLKGAAAATRLEDSRTGTSVVSQFVKDVLQDNASLQMGIVELREMLSGSNEEVQNLREQIMQHQAMVHNTTEQEATGPSMAEELAQSPGFDMLPELHVHHHYHAPAKSKSTSVRRPKKRRNVVSPGSYTPTSAVSGFSTPCQYGGTLPKVPSSTSSSAILSHTAVTIPPTQPGRRPILSPGGRSSFAPSSVPSTPQSAFRNSSFFDGSDYGVNYSRPTSPESVISETADPTWVRTQASAMSPGSLVKASWKASEIGCSAQNFSNPPPSQNNPSVPQLPPLVEVPSDPTAIIEEIEDASFEFSSPASTTYEPFRPSLHRSTSHESVLSIKESSPASHRIIRHHRSQLLNAPALKSRRSIAPVTTEETATAHRASSQSRDETVLHGQDFAKAAADGFHHPISSNVDDPGAAQIKVQDSSPRDGDRSLTTTSHGITARLNGWFVGKWGVTPTRTAPPPTSRASSTSNLRAKAALGAQLEKGRAVSAEQQTKRAGPPTKVPTRSTATAPASAPASAPTPVSLALAAAKTSVPPVPKLRHRPTGINQPGAIRGLVHQARGAERRGVVVEPTEVDLEGLRESLVEG